MNFVYFVYKYILTDEATSGKDKSALLITMELMVFMLSFFKVMFFLRIFQSIGHLIQML